MENSVINFLNKVNITVNSLEQLNNILIPRECLLNNDYNDLSNNILELKKLFSSSYMNSLHKTANDTQKWPILNLVRQVLKSCNYKMTPIRKSNGYTKDGKKIFKRYFKIEKIKELTTV
jgi:hypothetical protein